MIKLFSYRKIAITTLLLLVALILYNYPTYINRHIDYESKDKRIIYLIDLDNYVSMTNSEYNTINDLITLLKDNNVNDKFRGLIPSNTQVLNYDIKNGIINIDFSNDILSISSNDSLKMIESIVFSLTSFDNIDKVCIFVEGVHLDYVPNTNYKLTYYLDRSFGINKVYQIDTINNSTSVTVYYSKDDYYVPITLVSNDSSDKVSIIIKNLKSNVLYNSNLSSNISSNVDLIDYNYDDENIDLNFNDYFFNYYLDGSLKEEVKYTIFYSIYDTFGVKNVSFSINNKYISNFGLANS